MSHTHENLFLGTLPKRIILWCVDNDAFNGTFEKNPFHAKNDAIDFLAIYVDGRQVPAKPLQPNFETGHYIRSYVNLFSVTGKHAQDEGNELTRDDFGNGYTFFGFDLTPDACNGGCLHLVQKGNLRIEIHFAEALAQTVNVIVYAEFEAVLEIDKGRNIIYNHPWMQTDQISQLLSRDPMMCPYGVVAKDAEQPGEHWIAMYVDTKRRGDYFGPYGLEPQHIEFTNFMNGHCSEWVPNDRTLQSPMSTVCGQYCVAFLLLRCRNVSMHAFTRLFTTDLVANDCRVFDWIGDPNKNDENDVWFIAICCC